MKSLLFILFFLSIDCYGQQTIIKGFINDSKYNPIGFANIVVTDPAKNEDIIAFTFSDNEGNFSLTLPIHSNIIKLSITAIGYKELNSICKLDTVKNLNFIMEFNASQLETIIVKSQTYKDTVHLKIDSMNLTNESTLRDILKKTEGVLLSKDGSITFNGRPITKVLINNKEVFNNQNKIALDNLNYEIMDSVQILTNYKDKFNIDFNSVKNPVVNVKTKAKFKGVFKSTLALGIGYNTSYKIKGRFLFFSDKINTFLTSNTNNISEKDLSNKDVASSIYQNSTDEFKDIMSSFFIDDNLLKKDINSNNTLTLRNQTNNTKTGLVFTSAETNTQKTSNTLLSDLSSPIKNENYKEFQRGHLFSTNFNNSYLFDYKTVLNTDASAYFIVKNTKINNSTAIFKPTAQNILEETITKPNARIITVASNLSKAITKRMIGNFGIDYLNEQYENIIKTQLFNSINLSADQLSNTHKNIIMLNQSLEYKYKNWLALNFGFKYKYIFEDTQFDNSYTTSIKHRRQNIFEIPFTARGLTKNIEYDASWIPSFYHLQYLSPKKKYYTPIVSNFNYKFNASENLLISYKRNLYLSSIINSIDTILQSYNYYIINSKEVLNNFTSFANIDLGYYYSNIAKSKSYFLNISNQLEKNFIFTIFDATINNIFYYKNQVLERKKSRTISLGGSKGFYFRSKYHKIELSSKVFYSIERFPIENKNETKNYTNNKWQSQNEIILNLKKYFINEITFGINIEKQIMLSEKEKIFMSSIFLPFFLLTLNSNKFEGKIYFENSFYKTIFTKFQIPNCNISLLYKKNDNLTFSISGNNLLNLFQLNKQINTALNTFSDGRIISQTINNNRLGFVILNSIFKF